MFNRKQHLSVEQAGTSANQQISQQERVDLLRLVPLFSELSQREVRTLASAAIQRDYPAGTMIVRQGDSGVGLYVLISGRTLVWQRLPDGTDRQLATLGPRDMFGEMALLDRRSPPQATPFQRQWEGGLLVA